jgi:hypothetical protein
MENAVDFVFSEIVNGSVLGLDKYPFTRVHRDDRVVAVHSPRSLSVVPNLKDRK